MVPMLNLGSYAKLLAIKGYVKKRYVIKRFDACEGTGSQKNVIFAFINFHKTKFKKGINEDSS